jgi:predicted HicB family RNase H-like nuclease
MMQEFTQATETPVPTTAERQQEAHAFANTLFARKVDWVSFFREVLGVEGAVRRLFPTPQELKAFEKTEQYQQIQQMLAKLRGLRISETSKEPTRVITVRMPQSLHEKLRFEAHEKHTSMNKLCISKLLQMVDEQLVPSE